MDANAQNLSGLLEYLDKNPWDAAAIIWTLAVDATPVYAIRPQGAFASDGYQRLREFLSEQVKGQIERVSIGGVLSGTITLLSGLEIPLVQPELRCMYSWRTDSLIEAAAGKAPEESASAADQETYLRKVAGVRSFLERVYYEARNKGRSSQERAINYAATNAFNVARIFEAALKDEMELDTVEVEPSPVCPPGSDCWDVNLVFFNPRRMLDQARRAYRFTLDVSDSCPLMMGKLRSWSVR